MYDTESLILQEKCTVPSGWFSGGANNVGDGNLLAYYFFDNVFASDATFIWYTEIRVLEELLSFYFR